MSEMYAKAARELHSAGTDQDARAAVLDEIRHKLIERHPEREQFVTAFAERFYFTNEVTRDSKLVRYVLERFLRHASATTTTQLLTIEHIMPQGELKKGAEFETVGSLGNLLLVTEALNVKLDNKDFEAKRVILAQEGSAFDIGGVLDKGAWNKESIIARTKLLADRAYDEVWKLPL